MWFAVVSAISGLQVPQVLLDACPLDDLNLGFCIRSTMMAVHDLSQELKLMPKNSQKGFVPSVLQYISGTVEYNKHIAHFARCRLGNPSLASALFMASFQTLPR